MPRVKISPSILSADFGRLNEEIASIESLCDYLHFDVMDGHFVPNLSFGAPVLARLESKLPSHCHLMVTNPEELLEAFAKAGADMVIVHQEVTDDLHGLLEKIKSLGMEAGVSINPDTPVDVLKDVIGEVDQVLVMSVHPGFGGQSFIPGALDKIRALREMRADLSIAVDGGVNAETAPDIIAAGADIMISGSFIFKSDNRTQAIASLRGE